MFTRLVASTCFLESVLEGKGGRLGGMETVAVGAEESPAPEVGGGLERRRRRRLGGEDNGAPPEEEGPEAAGGGDHWSVYFHGENGIQSTDELSGMSIREVNHFITDKNMSLMNEKTDFMSKEFVNQENVPFNEEIQNSKNVKLGDGSNEGYSENGITRAKLEIEENVHGRLEKKSKQEVAEMDVERVLEEQETHDLYCPNCNSCITKRVILRKRKRTVREIQYDAPPAKVQQIQHDLNVTTAAAEMTQLDHESEPDIFRCLSCFSFFIPTESGFNIFRIFGKREETENLQTSHQFPAKNVNWISSIFKPVASIKKGSETGVSSPVESYILCSGVPSLEEKRSSLATPILEAAKLGEGQSTIGKNNADLMPWGSCINDGEQVDDQDKQDMQSNLVEAKYEGMKLGQSVTTMGKSETDLKYDVLPTSLDSMLWQSFINDGEQVGDQAKQEMQSDLVEAEYDGVKLGQCETTMGNSETGIMLPCESMSKQMEDATYIYQYNTTTTSISEAIVREGQTDIVQKLNDVLKRNDAGEDIVQSVNMVKHTFRERTSQLIQNIHDSVPSASVASTQETHETPIYVGEHSEGEAGLNHDLDVLKSIVYGGLIESVVSLVVVSSAAGSEASTLNIVALGLANLIGGLLLIAHNLSELRSLQEETADRNGEPVGRYWELLGRKANFRLHATVAVLAYIISGLLPPVIYGFSFRKSDKEYKLIAVTVASLVCIALLAIGKAHVKPQKTYIKTLAYYLALGVSASGLSYVSGVFIHRLLDHLGLFDNNAAAPAPPSIIYHDISSVLEAWASS